MQYATQVDIHLPVDRVVELFDNPDNLKEWQPGLISFEPLSGNPGQVGAKSKLCFKMGNREIEMIETITEKKLPENFSGTYEAKGVYNRVTNRFIPLDNQTTRYICDTEFRFSGMMKLMGWLMPGTFKKETLKHQNMFKEFAEKRNNS